MKIYKSALANLSERDFEKYLALMSDSRRNAVLRMRLENDRKRTVLGEMLARRAISEQSGIEEDTIIIHRAENGKPYCENASVCFSISHSKEYVVCAAGHYPIGADIEKIRFTEPRVAKMCCIESDFNYIFGTNELPNAFDAEQLERFFTLWTAKEAYCKFTGVGVSGMRSRSLSQIMPSCKIYKTNDYITAVYCENGNFPSQITELGEGE